MSYPLSHYVDLRVNYLLSTVEDYDPENDCSLLNCAVELALKAAVGYEVDGSISAVGKSDLRIDGRNFECKSGAGELSASMTARMLSGSGMVCYVPVPDERYPLERQEGYIMPRDEFIAALNDAGAIVVKHRSPKAGRGERYVIQTFWNRKQGKPHGRLLLRMQDAFDEHGAEMLDEFLSRPHRKGAPRE